MLMFGWGLKNLIDRGFSDTSGAYLNQALLVLFGVIIVLAAASFTRFYTVYWVAERAIADLRKTIFEKLLSLDPTYFENHKTGEEVSRINNDTTVLQMVVATNMPIALRHALTLMGGIVMLFVVSTSLTLLIMLVVPVVVVPIIFFGRKVRSRSRDTQSRIGDIAAFSHEALQGIQTIQSFGYEPQAAATFAGLADETFRTALKYIKMRSFLTAYAISIVFSAIGIVLWAGGHRVLKGEMTAGSLSAFVFFSVIVSGAVTSLSEALSAFNQASGAADRILGVLSVSSTLSGDVAAPGPIAGNIKFEDVTFSYPTRPGQHSLSNVSFRVQAGEVVALVGPSGAGKTTIFQLLQRFYDPQFGSIYLDDLKTSDCAPRDIRRHMTVVSQDPAIFSVSVAQNIRIGKSGASDAEVRHAAELAQAHEFISQLPQGYDTLVGERGSRLSGGQKQRIAIARAILKDAPVLLLDEATSALDSSNEVAVHAALKNLMKGRTTLIIAHRLSTVQSADRIVILDKGKIIAEGTHAELYGTDELYTHLAGLQMEEKAR
jgi:ATP-binding cassette subfamily B protein